jgi:uncharacterized protein YndB with AHSA1/START domain
MTALRATLTHMVEKVYIVERSVQVDAPPERVYDQVADFRKWTAWSPWEDLDPDLARTFSGADAGTGAAYRWSGNRKAGQGRMTITDGVRPSTVRIDLEFEKPWKARNDTVFSIAPDGAGSRVTWTMTGKKTLITKVMGLFKSMDALLGPDFEKGLARLKSVAEGR